MVDEVKPVALGYAREIGLGAEESAQIEQLYPDPETFAATLARDSADYYGQAMSSLGLPTSGRDPVAAAAMRFGAPLTLRDAAAELGLTEQALRSRLPELPWLAPLATGSLQRADFQPLYVASLCALAEGSALRRDPVLCESELSKVR